MASDPSELKHVVAFGGSAGAFKTIVRRLDRLFIPDHSCLFLVWHRAPHGTFHLENLVPHDIQYDVEMAKDGAPIELNHAYYPPDSCDLSVRDGHLRVEHFAERFRPNIDILFKSLAENFGPKVVAVLLSGGATDGVDGLREVQARGGLTIAEDPRTAEVPALPQAAIRAGVVERVLPSSQILHLTDRVLAGGAAPKD